MAETFKIYSHGIQSNGKPLFTESTKQILKKAFSLLTEGEWVLSLQPEKKKNNKRYNYYWGVVLFQAVQQMNERGILQIEIEDTGELVPVTAKDLHEMFKEYFNPVIIRYEGMRIIRKGSTTKMSDSEFIKEYLERIYMWLAEKDIIIESYDDYQSKPINRLK